MVIAFASAPWLGWREVAHLSWGLLLLNGILNGAAHFLIIEALRLAEVHAEWVDHDAVAVGQLRRRVGRGLARHGGHVAPAAAGDLLLRAVRVAVAGLDLGLHTGQLRSARYPGLGNAGRI